MKQATLLRTTALLGAASVGLGAFGAHGLEQLVAPEQVETFTTGVRYQFYHTLALGILAALGGDRVERGGTIVWLWLIGMLLFSGSLYLLSLRDVHGLAVGFLGPVTPIGGLLLIGGWIMLFVRAPRLIGLLLVVALAGCGSLGKASVQPQRYAITATFDHGSQPAAAREVSTTIAPYREQLREVMNREVARVASPLTKGRPESTLGNWTADLMAQAARELYPDKPVAFAVQNYGGIRVSEIGAGPLLVAELYELMPFDNHLVLVELTGSDLSSFIHHMAAGGGWPVSDGVEIAGPVDQLRIRIGGADIVANETYYVAMPDYVANGGDAAHMLTDKPQLDSGQLIRNLLIEYAGRSTGEIKVVTDGSRFSIEE
jgi:uncharacterized membrane protein YgdD (TMEM256/DUF423 family)